VFPSSRPEDGDRPPEPIPDGVPPTPPLPDPPYGRAEPIPEPLPLPDPPLPYGQSAPIPDGARYPPPPPHPPWYAPGPDGGGSWYPPPQPPPPWYPASPDAAATPHRAGELPAYPRPARPKRRWPLITIAAVVAMACLALLVTAAGAIHRELTRKPTAAELSRAASAAVARRWQAWPAGKIFPATLPYTTNLQVPEHAQRVGIDPVSGCAAGVDGAIASVLRRHGCRAVLRASYLDQRQGVVFTIGVVAFPGESAAAAARAQLHATRTSGLRAYAIPKTAAAWFTDRARQAVTVAANGPYVVLTTSGFSDGRAAAATGERRPSVFAPAGQLGNLVLSRLAAPAEPRCGAPGWTC
jgi:hypothetical protein